MSENFQVNDTELGGIKVIRRHPKGDSRGYLERLFCSMDLEPFLSNRSIEQINHTLTEAAGTVRGMHYQQPPHAELKLVMCLKGEVFDVAIDLRNGSRTFLQWHGEHLSEDNRKTLVIPEGFAHGFQTLTDQCEMLYLHTAAYAPDAEHGIHPRDPMIRIAWPQAITRLSERDGAHPHIGSDFSGMMV